MIKEGDICQVIQAPYESHQYYGLKAGDMVEVITVYPHHVYVERLGGGYRMRQSVLRKQWYRYLKKV